MRRMYLTLGAVLLLFLWAITVLGQKVTEKRAPTEQDRIKKSIELREELHRRMMEGLTNGLMSDDMFKDLDKMFEETMQDSMFKMESFSSISGIAPNFKSEWSETKTGRVLILTPKEGQQLDIDVNKSMITIKGKSVSKTENGSFSSNFSNSFSIPDDCDGSKVKISQKDSRILVELPFRAETVRITRPKQDERVPLKRSKNDIDI